MAKRPSISSVMGLVGGAVQAAAGQLAAGGTAAFFASHRAELISVIQQAQTERAAALLDLFCQQFPWAAGLVNMAMGGDVDTAIATIGIYDGELADHLKQHRGNVEKLQEYWRLGGANKQSS